MITTRKRSVATYLVAAGLGTITAGPASAQSVADGTDPNNTGCSSTASTEYSVQDPAGILGLLELRWSSGCGTAWARFTCQQDYNQLGCSSYKIYIRRDTDGKNYSVTVNFPTYTPIHHQLYTLQLNDGPWVSAKACFHNQNTGATACTNSW